MGVCPHVVPAPGRNASPWLGQWLAQKASGTATCVGIRPRKMRLHCQEGRVRQAATCLLSGSIARAAHLLHARLRAPHRGRKDHRSESCIQELRDWGGVVRRGFLEEVTIGLVPALEGLVLDKQGKGKLSKSTGTRVSGSSVPGEGQEHGHESQDVCGS